MADDFLDDVMRQLAAAVPELTADQALRLERQIRTVWGGEQVYIGKRTAQGKALRLAEALRAGVCLGQAIHDAGLATRTGYRLLSRRWRIR